MTARARPLPFPLASRRAVDFVDPDLGTQTSRLTDRGDEGGRNRYRLPDSPCRRRGAVDRSALVSSTTRLFENLGDTDEQAFPCPRLMLVPCRKRRRLNAELRPRLRGPATARLRARRPTTAPARARDPDERRRATTARTAHQLYNRTENLNSGRLSKPLFPQIPRRRGLTRQRRRREIPHRERRSKSENPRRSGRSPP